MIKLYFICMGNYYRSRLAEELALHYAAQRGLEIAVDSGGLTDVARSLNPGPIAKATLRYLAEKHIVPKYAHRYPKQVDVEGVFTADYVILTDEDEQLPLFKQAFPHFTGHTIGWRARDNHDDPWLQTPFLIDKHVLALIEQLAEK